MKQTEVKAKIEKLLQENLTGVLSTVENQKPYARYMTFFADGFTLYTATQKETEKVAETEKNPYVHVLLGYEGEGFGDSYLAVSGKAEASSSPELKKKIWNKHLENWFTGPDDPQLTILTIHPDSILLLNNNGEAPQELRL